MKKTLYLSFALMLLITGISSVSCKKDAEETPTPEAPYTPTPYTLRVPTGWSTPVIPDFNPTTVEGIRLGRMLFYDDILSMNGRSCSSCHHPDKSYSTPLFITCLLYTSDAADERSSVDLGGRRIIKKNKNEPIGSSHASQTNEHQTPYM